MKVLKVRNYHEMSVAGAVIIHEAVMAKLSRGEHFNLGLATGNTMIGPHGIPERVFRAEKNDPVRFGPRRDPVRTSDGGV